VRVCELLSKKSAAANQTFEMRSLSAAVAARKPSPSESHALSDSEPADSRALLPCALLAVFGKALPICLVAAPVWNSLLIRHSHCIITHLHLGAGRLQGRRDLLHKQPLPKKHGLTEQGQRHMRRLPNMLASPA